MKKCELCKSLAKMHCESDQASLCWECDGRVHAANFLVAKHSRTLLCHLCQSFTPWTASGPRLSPTVSVCDNCVNDSSCRQERRNHSHDDDDDDDTDDSEDDGGDEDDEENQVVPWSCTTTAPPPVSSSSNSDQESSSRSDEGVSQSTISFSLKRMRESTQDHRGYLLPQDNRNVCMSNESAFLGTSSII